MKNGYVVLSDNFALKAAVSEQILFDLRNGTRYVLDPTQFDFLQMCDGRKTLSAIIAQYNRDSRPIIREFIANLQKIGAIKFSASRSYRKLPKELMPDISLKAVHLEPSIECNMRCAHCYQGNLYSVENSLTLNEIESLADQMQAMQVQGVSISGGEPFLWKTLFEIFHLFEKREMRVISVFTNGLLLDDEIINRITSFRSQPTLFVSLDSITPAGMKFRGFENPSAARRVLDKTLENIHSMVAKKVSVVINTVMNRYNVRNLRKMHNLIGQLGINSWRIGFPKNTGSFKDKGDEFGLEWEVMAAASFKLLKHHFHLGRPFHLQMEYLFREELFEDFQPLPNEAFVCDYERKRETCCIKPNGDVVSCAYCTDFPIGNIRQDTLRNIWYSKAMQAVKEVRIADVKGCQGCELRPYCATGCRINAYFINGDFWHAKDDYACKAVRFFVDKVMPFLKKEGVIK